MPSISNLRLAAIMLTLAVTLSGGCGGPTVDPWMAPPADYYKPLGNNTATTTSTFSGVGIRDSEAVVQASGTFVHNTGAITYNDGSKDFNAPAGFIGGTAEDVIQGTLLDMSNAYAGTYDYVMPIGFNYKILGVDYTTTGFAGITTDAVHVPVSGSATYIGEAAGQAHTPSLFSFNDWVSTISVNFGAGSVNVILEPEFGVPTAGPFDEVQITGMTIAGNTFTGGQLSTLLGGETLNLIGAITSTESLGMFFGWDNANLIPDEVGGVSIVAGATGEMLFLFVGD